MKEGTLLYCDPFVFKNGATPNPERDVNAYVFEAGEMVTDSFCFPRRTFVYGEQVDDYSEDDLSSMNSNIQYLGVLKPDIFAELKI